MSRTLPAAAEIVGRDGLTATDHVLLREARLKLSELNRRLERRGSPLRYAPLIADAPHAGLFVEPPAVEAVEEVA